MRWRRSYSSRNAHIFSNNSSLGLWIRHSTWRRLQSLREVAILWNARICISFLLTGMTRIFIWLIDLFLFYVLLISHTNIMFIALYFLDTNWAKLGYISLNAINSATSSFLFASLSSSSAGSSQGPWSSYSSAWWWSPAKWAADFEPSTSRMRLWRMIAIVIHWNAEWWSCFEQILTQRPHRH